MTYSAMLKACLFSGALCLLIPFCAAGEPLTPEKLDQMPTAIDNLLAFTDSEDGATLDLDLIPPLLDFVDAPKALGETFPLADRNGAASDYYEFTIERSFDWVIGLVYHPNLPTFLTVPSSVRRSHWIEINGKNQPFPALDLDDRDRPAPVIIKGIEFIENSPDSTTGTYYAYNLKRALILLNHNGRRVLISVSTQPAKSQVGKKGLILGNDEQWDYLYTGEKGTGLTGLGWASTYIYDSNSVMIYYETETASRNAAGRVKCATFKWIKAGWSGMNFVESIHIRQGVQRFAKDFQAIIESPTLPGLDDLASIFGSIERLSADELRKETRDYFDHLRRYYQDRNPKYEKWFAKLLNDPTYLKNLSREEMLALISLEQLKRLVGKPHHFETGQMADSADVKKPS